MCAPAIGLIGAGVSAVGSIASANAQAQGHQYNATVAKINARSERWEGQAQQEDIYEKGRRAEGTAIANTAKGGIDPGFGSAALAIFGDNYETSSRDANRAYISAESRAVAQENKAKQEEAAAKAAKTSGQISAASSFLGGLGSVARAGGGLMING